MPASMEPVWLLSSSMAWLAAWLPGLRGLARLHPSGGAQAARVAWVTWLFDSLDSSRTGCVADWLAAGGRNMSRGLVGQGEAEGQRHDAGLRRRAANLLRGGVAACLPMRTTEGCSWLALMNTLFAVCLSQVYLRGF